jgi:hypothetical protein
MRLKLGLLYYIRGLASNTTGYVAPHTRPYVNRWEVGVCRGVIDLDYRGINPEVSSAVSTLCRLKIPDFF